jgi:hypothetical protein
VQGLLVGVPWILWQESMTSIPSLRDPGTVPAGIPVNRSGLDGTVCADELDWVAAEWQKLTVDGGNREVIAMKEVWTVARGG